jgi:hypothetical protein
MPWEKPVTVATGIRSRRHQVRRSLNQLNHRRLNPTSYREEGQRRLTRRRQRVHQLNHPQLNPTSCREEGRRWLTRHRHRVHQLNHRQLNPTSWRKQGRRQLTRRESLRQLKHHRLRVGTRATSLERQLEGRAQGHQSRASIA